MTRTALLLALALSVTASAQTSKAKALNSDGYRLYKAANFAEAIGKFREATVADPKFALGWYNLAATLSLMRKQNKTCDFDAYRKNVTDALARAVALDKKRRDRMQSDSDLDPIRDTIAYQRLLGVNAATVEGLGKLLVAVSWWGPAVGAFGSPYGVDFLPNNEATYWEHELDPEGTPMKKSYPARWKVEKSGTIQLGLPARGAKNEQLLRGTFDGQKVTFEGAEVVLSDQPSECEA